MTSIAKQSYASQMAVTIVCILTKYVQGFETQAPNTLLHHIPHWPLPPRPKTIFYPLPATTMEEASIDGNLLVHDDVYLVQLKWPSDELNKLAVPTLNVPLMNTWICSRQLIFKKDISHLECCEIFQLAFGSFHLAMNLL